MFFGSNAPGGTIEKNNNGNKKPLTSIDMKVYFSGLSVSKLAMYPPSNSIVVKIKWV